MARSSLPAPIAVFPSAMDALLEASAHPIVVFEVHDGGELVVACANRAALTQGRVLDSSWKDRLAQEVLPEDSYEALEDGYRECLRLGIPHAYEEFVVVRGKETWWMTTLAPLFGEDGLPCHLVATHLPVDFVRSTEEALRRSERSFKNLIDASPDPILVLRHDGSIAYSNQATSRLLRVADPNALLDRSVHDFVVATSARPLSALLGHVLSSKAPDTRPVEQVFCPEVGDPVTVEAVLMRLSHDGAPCVLVVARDVTEVRAMQLRLAANDHMASLGRIAAGVAHEINNPLAYVHANLHYAMSELERIDSGVPGSEALDVPMLLNALRDGLDGAARVRAIVRDLKGLAYLDDHADGQASVSAALSAALKLAHLEVRYRARLTSAIPELPAVIGSESRLVQVFLNLIVNAAQAIEEGRIEENEIRVVARLGEQGTVVVEVSDTGSGISEHQVPALFDPFFTTKPSGMGLGLGLSICQQIVHAAGGRIDVDSRLGHGSTFRVVLRVGDGETPQAPRFEPKAPRAVRRARVLVIDDEPVLARALGRILGRLHDVTIETDAASALATIAQEHAFDVIFCDYTMPNVNGAEFYARLELSAPQLVQRVVFLSGGVFTEAGREFLDNVPNPCLEKPVDASALLALIERMVAGATPETDP
jgi:PAS domain S-box-containing protein